MFHLFSVVISTGASRPFAMRSPVISTGVFALLRRRSGEIAAFRGRAYALDWEKKCCDLSTALRSGRDDNRKK